MTTLDSLHLPDAVLVAPDAAGPPPELLFRRRVRLGAAVREFWGARELVRSLVERDLRARYKQAVLGVAWALVTPLTLMVVFTFVFRRVGIETGGAPYPLFAYLGLLPWTFFSASLSQGGQSLVLNADIVRKVYCPREVFPVAAVLVAAIDMAIATVALGLLFAISGTLPRAASAWAPLFVAIQAAFTLGVTMVVSGVMVYYRDLRHALPVVLQLGLFATPVAYGLEVIPAALRRAYVAANPLGAVIDGYRRTMLLGQAPAWDLLAIASASALLVLVLGYLAFKRMEGNVADAV